MCNLLNISKFSDLVNPAHLKMCLGMCGSVEIQSHSGFILIKDSVAFCT